jgi:hypothetical protein
MTVRESVAYTFKSDLTIEQMLDRLNEVGPWTWMERDNDRWANYMSATPFGDALRQLNVKIITEPENQDLFAVGLIFRSESPDVDADRALLETTRRTLFDRVLPAIGARELTKTDNYE